MSTEQASKKYVHIPRVASFTEVTSKKGERTFTPVNDRAKKLVRKLGKRKYVTATQLRDFKDYYKLRQYKNGKLTTVRV